MRDECVGGGEGSDIARRGWELAATSEVGETPQARKTRCVLLGDQTERKTKSTCMHVRILEL